MFLLTRILFLAIALGSLCIQTTAQEHSKIEPEKPETIGIPCIVSLSNGNRITAHYTRWTKDRIHLTSPHFSQDFSLSTNLISRVDLEPIAAKPSEKAKALHRAKVTLISKQPNETILKTYENLWGKIVAIDDQSLTLETSFAKPFIIPRSSIDNIDIEDISGLIFKTPIDFKGWKNHVSTNKWQISGNDMLSSGVAYLSKEVGLTTLTHTSFSVNSATRNFQLKLYAKENPDDELPSYYHLRVSSNSFRMTKVLNGANVTMQKKTPKHKYPTKRIRYDIYSDLTKGTFTIYTDGVHACTYTDNKVDSQNFGKEIHLMSSRYPQIIHNFVIKKWGGVISSSAPQIPAELDGKGEIFSLRNGDFIRGALTSVEEGKFIIKTEHHDLKVPIQAITNLTTKEINPTIKYVDSKHLTLVSHDNDKIMLKFLSMNGHLLKGQHNILGTIDVDTRKFHRIEFTKGHTNN